MEDINLGELSSIPSVKIPRQYLLNPIKLILGLQNVLEKMSVQFFYKTRILDFSEKDCVVLTTNTGVQICTKDVIFATHSPLGKIQKNNYFLSYQTFTVSSYWLLIDDA